MEKWGIIGGTFDPIHIAHLYIAEVAMKKLNLEKVIFMPAGSPPHKTDRRITEASLRLEMVNAAIKGKKGFEVSDYEIQNKGMSYTYKTLEYFNNKKREIYFIVGSDCLMNLHKWREVDKIFSLCKLVVVTRPGFSKSELIKKKIEFEEKYNGEIIFLEVEGKDISSTEIKEYIKEGLEIEKLLPKEVIEIINKKGLYRGE
ncbi:MAG: nicotinate-nucleotide adenylyltransferase [Clostridiales bacterium]|nr:nicotinate-nucleotide adenylyltransferase [Clostridiales bacterium]